MPDDTPILSLPLILPAQAQKHVTHNEALRLLDIVVQLAVHDRDRTAPPATPTEGDRYIVADGATGSWAGKDGRIAAFWGGTWAFVSPADGWLARVLDENLTLVYRNGIWEEATDPPHSTDYLGINTTADTLNRLAVSAPATLLTHDGAGHQLKVNKAAPGDTASLLFQSGWSGRAEMGLAGNDDFSIKISPDGTNYVTGLAVAAASGAVRLPQAVTMDAGLTVAGQITGTAVQTAAHDVTQGRLLKVGAFGLGTTQLMYTNGNVADCNALPGTGIFAYHDVSSQNSPPGYGVIWHAARFGVAQHAQIACSVASDKIYVRRLNASNPAVWFPWREIYHAGSILGTVAQSGGTPTGAVIERGSNANGDYVRFADGTQICTRSGIATTSVTTPDGALFRGGNFTVTLPASFVAPPVITPGQVAGGNIWVTAVSATNATATFMPRSPQSTVGTTVAITAIGRWF
jgi:hypothetical protein